MNQPSHMKASTVVWPLKVNFFVRYVTQSDVVTLLLLAFMSLEHATRRSPELLTTFLDGSTTFLDGFCCRPGKGTANDFEISVNS